MKFFITLLGLVLVLEGLPYVAFPEAMRGWLKQLVAMPVSVLRGVGLIAMAFGLFLCYLTQRTNFF